MPLDHKERLLTGQGPHVNGESPEVLILMQSLESILLYPIHLPLFQMTCSKRLGKVELERFELAERAAGHAQKDGDGRERDPSVRSSPARSDCCGGIPMAEDPQGDHVLAKRRVCDGKEGEGVVGRERKEGFGQRERDTRNAEVGCVHVRVDPVPEEWVDVVR